MTLGGIHFSTGTDTWATPHVFFDRVNARFRFNLDACASYSNTKCERFYTESDDGLKKPWETWTWCNPPYSDIINWYEKAYDEMVRGNSSVLLTFARTDTKAFHLYGARSTEIVFVKGRLKFIDPATGTPGNPAPSPSMLVVFDASKKGEQTYSTMDTKG